MANGKLEAAFEADRSADPESWTWTDLSALTQANATTISRGKTSGRGTVAEPAQASFPLRNGGGTTGVTVGSLTPRKATGDWYPGVRKGLPLRFSYNLGASTLALTGASASKATTPDAASLDITGPIAIAVQFRAPIRPGTFGGAGELAGKWGAAGQRSWRLLVGQFGTLNFQWSVDGTATTGESATVLALPSPDAGPLTAAIEFDNDNGAGGNTGTFYALKGTITDLLASPSSYLFGDPDTNVGTTSIFSSTADLEIGSLANTGFTPYAGCIDAWFIRDGTLSAGTIAADTRNLPSQAAGTTSFADQAATPKTWTIAAPATITDRKIRLLGEYGTNQGDFPGHGVDGTARRTITVAGPLRRMRQGAKPLQSALYRRITAPVGDTTVYDYYPLEDGRDATTAFAPIGGGTTGGLGGSVSLAADDSLAASQALPQVSGGQPFGWSLPLSAAVSATTWEYTMVAYIPVAPVAGSSEYLDLQRIDCVNGVTSQWVLRIDDTNVSVFAKDFGDPPTNILSATFGSDARFFGDWIIITLSIGLSGMNITWDVDITPLSVGATFGSSGTLASFGLSAGSPSRLRNLMTAAPQEGWSFGHFIITTAAATGWLAPADTAYVGEPDTTRVARLCREQGIPVIVDGPNSNDWAAAIAAGAQRMGPQRALPLPTLLEECARVGNGYLGEARELLGIWYRAGATLENQEPRISASTEVTQPFESFDDDATYVNSVEVSRPDGSRRALVASGDDDPETVGLYEDSREVNVPSDADLADHASWWLHEATWPEERHDTIPLDIPVTTTAQIAAMHDLSVGDVIEATSLPSAADATTVTQLVDGWTETDSPFLWQVRPNTRPAGPWEVGVLEDAARGKLGTAGSELSTGIDDNDTSLSVATTLGPLWDPADAQDGFDIAIGGERMTVTDISGTSSPQTFTVTRSVNGVVKAHDAGATVRLWRPTIIAL